MEQVNWLFENYPAIKHILMIMFVFRIIFKTTFTILGKYVELTVIEDDNKRLYDFMLTKKYRMMVFIVDLLASVKLPKIKK